MLRQAANDVLRNDVALRAKGKLHFPNTNALDFQGLFVFLGVKNNPFHHCTFLNLMGLNQRHLSAKGTVRGAVTGNACQLATRAELDKY
jgi:hypothetical protein